MFIVLPVLLLHNHTSCIKTITQIAGEYNKFYGSFSSFARIVIIQGAGKKSLTETENNPVLTCQF